MQKIFLVFFKLQNKMLSIVIATDTFFSSIQASFKIRDKILVCHLPITFNCIEDMKSLSISIVNTINYRIYLSDLLFCPFSVLLNHSSESLHFKLKSAKCKSDYKFHIKSDSLFILCTMIILI